MYRKKQTLKTKDMTTKEFLTENKEQVVNYYNENVNGLYNISLKNFMVDLMNNFRKITLGEELKKYDLFGNLQQTKSRLGMMDVEIGVTYTTPYSESNHSKRVKYFGQNSQLNNL